MKKDRNREIRRNEDTKAILSLENPQTHTIASLNNPVMVATILLVFTLYVKVCVLECVNICVCAE